MGLHKLTAGDGYTYLTRQVAAHDTTEKGHRSLGDYYDQQGESPGQWHGSGLTGLDIAPGQNVTAEQMRSLFGEGRHPDARTLEGQAAATGGDARTVAAAGALGRRFPVYQHASTFNTYVARAFSEHNGALDRPWDTAIPAETRAELRTQVGTRLFTEEHDRPPLDARELSGFIAHASRQATTAVAGYDLTFSPVKSVSTLWALAEPAVADQVRAAHDAAVADTLRWLEREATFTRLGRGGVRQVTTRGLIAATFTHRDSRSGDPDLHTHVAISNKVQVASDPTDPASGAQWLALDGRMIYQANVAASERYNTRLEAELTARLGVRFSDSPTTGDQRPVREVDGINHLLTRWWSRRRRDIDIRRSELAADFQRHHGRPPTAVEAIALAQQATLETRAAKHSPRSERDQRAAWRTDADRVLGGPAEVDHMFTRVLGRRPQRQSATPGGVEAAAAATLEAVEAHRATWQVWHLRAEAERQARRNAVPKAHLDQWVDHVVTRSTQLSVRLGAPDPIQEPAQLQRPDGSSAYDVHGSTRYSSARVLAAEQHILTLADRTGGRVLSHVRVEVALARSTAEGVELNEAQTAMVRELATSDALVRLALAPAGTGKTTAMRTLAQAWSDADGHVVGLAPSAQAAHELRTALPPGGAHTDTLAKLSWSVTHSHPDQWPRWIHKIGPRTMVILDEAGQAATHDLATALDFITRRGGVVRLLGDDQQLAAVAAGGVLRDLQRRHGAVTLSEVRRFDDLAEAAASLALREGDISALGFYADDDRVHVGDPGAVTDHAYTAWATDARAGLETVLLAPTRDLVTELNARARTDRMNALEPGSDQTEVTLFDGNHASAGDVIITKRNERKLPISASDWVTNGDRWTVTAVHPDRSITARHHRLARHMRLPAAYVADHVQLGYATTVHGAQGMTTDTTHAVVNGDEARQLLYVALSRGRRANHVYLATGHTGDPHDVIRTETLLPPTAHDVLIRILERDGSQQSATTTQHDASSPAVLLHEAVTRYRESLYLAAVEVLGTNILAGYDAQLEQLHPGLSECAGYPALRSRVAFLSLDGHDPLQYVDDLITAAPVNDSTDAAAVLHMRLDETAPKEDNSAPLPWLDGVPDALTTRPDWGHYLAARADRVSRLASVVSESARDWSPRDTPIWAHRLTAFEHAELRADLAVWRAAMAIPHTEHRPSGHLQRSTRLRDHQRTLDRRLRQQGPHGRPGAHDSLIDMLPDAAAADPRRHRLTQRLADLSAAGMPVADLVVRATRDDKPLPADCPADALWWRITRHLGPVALKASRTTSRDLRPAWIPALVRCLGEPTARRVIADSSWPALVAAIGARPTDWTAEALIEAVAEPSGAAVLDEDLCTALIWRCAVMTDPPTEPDDDQGAEAVPVDPVAPEIAPAAAPDILTTSVARIVQLNGWAADHYEDIYALSWAPAYLRQRLHTDLTDDARFRVGYAPPGPHHLVRHLTSLGARHEEVVDAGLARRRDDGQYVDVFRDRLVLPIHDSNHVVGFVARRNPNRDNDPYTGPKYLNTRATNAFSKGTVLFGEHEGSGALSDGATPVLVEGPIDAIAVTLASPRFVGMSPLGTALTDRQLARLRPLVAERHANIVVATDADSPGWLAAQKAFWRLVAQGAHPRHLLLDSSQDPAALFTADPTLLIQALDHPGGLGVALLEDLARSTDLPDTASRLWISRDAAQIMAPLPPHEWPALITAFRRRTDLPAGVLEQDLLDAADEWSADPISVARHQLRRLEMRTRQLERATTPGAVPNVPRVSSAQPNGDRSPTPPHTLRSRDPQQTRSAPG